MTFSYTHTHNYGTPLAVRMMLKCLHVSMEAGLKKVAHYRRAMWVGGLENTLEQMLDDAFEGIEDNILPTFRLSGSVDCMLARRTNHNGARFMHFVTYEEGAPVAVINTQVQADAVDADEQDPEGENEFIQAQLFCLVSGNNIVWATHNDALREGKIQDILASFALQNDVPIEQVQFGFQVVLDQDVIQSVFEEGIEEIDLNLGDFSSTIERISNGGQLPDLGFFSKLTNMVRTPVSREQVEAAQHVEGKLVLRPGRKWDKPDVRDLMVGLSNDARQNYEEDFVIVTKRGLRLTREKMTLSKNCEVQGTRRILNSVAMETELRGVLQAFREANVAT